MVEVHQDGLRFASQVGKDDAVVIEANERVPIVGQLVQDELLDDIDLSSLCSWDFIFFCTLAVKGARVYSPHPVPDEPQRLYFHAPEGPNGIILQQADSQVRLIIKGDRAFAEQALAVVRQWQTIGKPQAADYVFEGTAEGRQFFRLPLAQLSFEVQTE